MSLDRTLSHIDVRSKQGRRVTPPQGELMFISVNRSSSNSISSEQQKISHVTEIHYLCPQEEEYISPTERIPDHYDIFEFQDIAYEECN